MTRVKSRHPSSSVFFEINFIIRDMKSEKEIWKPVVGYDGLYEVSNYGRIRSVGDRLEGDIALIVAPCKVDHNTQGIAPF